MKHQLIAACLMIALPTLALAGPGEPGHSHAQKHDHAHSHAFGDTPFGKPGNPKMKAQTIELRMVERDGAMAFEPNEIKVKKGEQVRLRLANAGLLDHEIVIGTLEMHLKHAEEMKKNPDMEHDDPNGNRLATGEWPALGDGDQQGEVGALGSSLASPPCEHICAE